MLLGKLCEQVNNNNRKQGGLLPDECRLRGGQLEGGALEEGQEEAKSRRAGWGEEYNNKNIQGRKCQSQLIRSSRSSDVSDGTFLFDGVG